MDSCRRTVLSISSSRNFSYWAWVMVPARRSARMARTFCVCGKEPIVVVGKSGSEMDAACAARRAA